MIMPDRMRQRKRIHLEGFDYSNSAFVYFLTICTADKQAYFAKDEIAAIVVDEMEFRRTSEEIRLFCYCIMPDHLHMLVSLTEGYQKGLQNWVSAFKRHTAKTVGGLNGIKPLWQKNFYDHVVRKEESLVKIAEYIVNNPVRKGLVARWEEYPYSRMVDPLPV